MTDAILLDRAPRAIKLPQYVIICGSDKLGNLKLANAIFDTNSPDQCPTPSKAAIYFLVATIELGDPECAVEISNNYTKYAATIEGIDAHLRGTRGDDWVGQMMAKQLKEQHEDIIFWDGDSPKDYAPFVRAIDKDAILFIITGALTCEPIPGARTIWLPKPDLIERMSLLRRECGEY